MILCIADHPLPNTPGTVICKFLKILMQIQNLMFYWSARGAVKIKLGDVFVMINILMTNTINIPSSKIYVILQFILY